MSSNYCDAIPSVCDSFSSPSCCRSTVYYSIGMKGQVSKSNKSTDKIIDFHVILFTHSWSWALLEKLPIVQLLENFPAFYGTRRFITAFTWAFHRSQSSATSIQSLLSHPTSLRSILILSTHLHLGLPSGLFPSGFPTNILYAFLRSPHSCYMPCPSHPPWLDHSNYAWRRVQVMKLFIM
jgi:hypothetical protein